MEKHERVLFCRVAWMKHYQGVTDSDKPVNGGSYVKINKSGAEINNFFCYNHFCRGYVRTPKGEMNLNRILGSECYGDELDGVTVIFVARHPNKNSYIVGWYNNATVFREGKYAYEAYHRNEGEQYYCMQARCEDCVLIPAAKRHYVIPNATKLGKGQGMGQSNIWYADNPVAAPARESALEYIANYKGPTEKLFYTADELSRCAKDVHQNTEQLLSLGRNTQDPYQALQYINLALKKERTFDAYRLRGLALTELFYYDEAEEALRRALYEEPDNTEIMRKLQEAELMRENYGLSIEMGNRLLPLLEDGEEKALVVLDMEFAWAEARQPKKALELLNKYEALCKNYNEWAKQNWNAITSQLIERIKA